MVHSKLTAEQVRAVVESAADDPNASYRSITTQTGVSKSAVGRIILQLSRRGIALRAALQMEDPELLAASRSEPTPRPRDPDWKRVLEARRRGTSYIKLYERYCRRKGSEPVYSFSTYRRHYLTWLESRGISETPDY